MKVFLITIISIFVFFKSYGQDTIQVVRHYDNHKPKSYTDSIFNSIPNVVFVDLCEGFNDSLYITVNDQIVLNKYLITNGSIGRAGGFVISFKDSTDIKALRVKFIRGKRLFEERVNLNYKSLEIRRRSNHCELTYTNHFPILE